MGKTQAAVIIGMSMALDPTVELHVHDFKGMGDWAAFEQVAHVYNGDASTVDPVAALRADLEQVVADMNRRAGVIAGLVRNELAEGVMRPRKLTPDDVADRSLGLVPVWVSIDECQVPFTHPEHGKAIVALVDDIVRRGRALGVMVNLDTQKPSSEAVPTDVRDNVSLRYCLYVKTNDATDMVLGDGASKAGYRPHETLCRDDIGIGYWQGAGGDPILMRFDYVADHAPVLARARAERARLGRLTGQAAGEVTEVDVRSILDDLAEVWPATDDRAWLETMAGWLADRWPDRYAHWDGRTVGADLRSHRLEPRQINVDGTNRRGLDRSQLLEALAARDHPDG